MIEADLLALIRASIRSVWTLEVLLLLANDRGKEWTEAEMIGELRASAPIVRESLAALHAAGLVASGPAGGSVFEPRTPELAEAAARLERAYRVTPIAVMKAIAAAPHDRVQVFADAFRFKQ